MINGPRLQALTRKMRELQAMILGTFTIVKIEITIRMRSMMVKAGVVSMKHSQIKTKLMPERVVIKSVLRIPIKPMTMVTTNPSLL